MAEAPQSRPADGREGRATPAAVLALPLLGAACLALVATLRAQVPDWWLERGFISTNAPVATDDFAPANQGQVKHAASIAAQELEAKLPGGAGSDILSMVAGWTNNTSGADDFAPLNLGQLKAVAAPFYQRFSGLGILTNDYPWTAGLSNGYPWTGGSDANDFAVANIGQIKFAFAFDLSPWNSDDDHLPDAWEQAHFGAGNLAQGDTGDPDGDGIPNIGEYLGTSDPTNVFSGAGAAIFVVAGDGQAGSTNRFLAGPLVVGATNSLGPLVGASLEFSVDLGDGLLSATNDGSGLTNPIALATGPDGTAPAWLRFGSIDFLTNRVTVSAGGLAPLTFLALLDDGDLDQDGLPDAWEAQIVGALPNDPITDIRHVHPGDDFDADTLDNAGEFGAGTNPVDPDSDDDAIPDGWEHRHGSDPLAADAEGDADRDGITNLIEYRLELNLVAWYRLDGDGTDSSTNHLDAPADGAVPTQDRFGAASAALYFNGGVVYQTNGSAVVTNGVDLEVTNSVALNLSTTHQRTISLWFNAARFLSLTNQVLWEEGANVRGINIYLHGDRLLAGAYNTNKNESGWPGNWIDMGPVQTGRWYHVALVLNASNAVAPDALRAYLDGQYMGNAPGSQIWAHSGLIGAAGMRGGAIFHDGYVGGNGRRFKGSLDEIRIYRRALTAEEVAALSPDADMDGLPDRWEQALVDAEPADGIETIRDLLPEDDFDFDGVPNRVEYKLSLNLAAWYPLDGDGTDLSGHGLDATAVGAVAAGDRFGRGGASLAFDGATGVLEGTNSSWINLGVHAMHTVSLWFNADRITGGTSRQVLWEQGNATKGLNIYLSNSWVFAGAWNRDASQSDWDGDWLSGGPIATGTWHHVALVLDGGPTVSNGALRASLDGASLGDAPGSQLWPHSGLIGAAASRGGTRFNLGSSTGSDGHRLQGCLDEIRIYNCVPDEETMAALGPDVDQDGMADTWEQPFVDSLPNDAMRGVRNFLPGDDFDGDGLSNIEEYRQARDLTGWWRFDEGSGTSAADGSGWGAHGALSGGAAWTSGAMGGAVSLDGADDRVTVPHGAGIDLGAGGADFSVAFWINLRAGATGNWRAVMHKGAANMQRTFGVWMRPESNALHARVSTTASDDEGIDASSPIPVGSWTHVALVKEGASLRLYVNGALDREVTLAGTTVSNTGALAIGDDDWSDATACWLDDLRAYRRALSGDEVALLGPDVDRDGMDDAWERGFADADPEDDIESEWDFHPGDDFDLDGVLNLDEYRLRLDLAACYALDGDGNDAGGNGLHASVTGALAAADRNGGAGGALDFDGITGLLSVPDSAHINGGVHGARTVSLWFRPDDLGPSVGRQVLWGEGDTNRGINVYLTGERLYAGGWNRPAEESGWDPGDWIQSGPLSTGGWHHVALILEAGPAVSNGAMRVLLDGQELGSAAASQIWGHAPAGAAAMRDGMAFHDGDGTGEGARFAGALDELRIYNRALSPSEAAALGPDADRDGMADDWERQLVDADPDDAIRSIRDLSPDDDFDGDGVPNGIEYRLGLGLAAWYGLDGDGTDSSGNGLDATLAGAIAAIDRMGGADGAMAFDGISGLLSVPDSGRINGGIHGARTVSLWFNADLFGETNGHRVLWGEGDTNRGLGIYLSGDRLFAGGWNRPAGESGWDPGDWVQSGPLATGRWYHVALVLDGGPAVSNGAVRVQLDGLALGEAPGSQLWPHGPAGSAAMRDGMAFHDGDESGEGARFQGRLDDIRVYDRALAPEEAAALVPDADQDGLPDGWEARLVDADPNDAIRDIWGLLPGDDFDGDGTSNLGEYGGGSDAADYFNGEPFLLAIEGGDGQEGYRSHFLGEPFSVLVTATNGVALSNAPVAFAALDPGTSSVAGRHDPSGLAASAVARTDGDGRAIAWGYLRSAPGATNRFTARASSPGASTNLEFLAVTRTDLVGDWRFAEGGGGTTADESGFGNHGTLMGAIEWMPGDGVDPGALFYDGENSWVRVPRADALDPAGEMTIAAWVKIGNDSTNRFYRLVSRKEHWADQAGYELEYNPYQKRLTFCGRGAEQLVAYDVDLGLGQWRHVAVTLTAASQSNRYDGAFYVDGKPLAQYTVPEVPGFWRTNVPRVAAWPASPYWGGPSSNATLSAILPSPLPMGLGRDPALRNDNLKGLLDDVRLYRRGLSAEEIHRLWFIDNDGDGLLDTWEMNYFGDLLASDGLPGQNFDRDGFTDREEHDNGTDPTDYYNGELPETDPHRSASMAVLEADLADGVPLALQIFGEQGGTNVALAGAPVFFAIESSGTEIQGTNAVPVYSGRLSLVPPGQAGEFGLRAPMRTDSNGVATIYFSATDAQLFASNAPVTVAATIVAGDRMKVVEYHLSPYRGEIGYWPMDQRIGWVAPDATTNRNNGYYNKTNPDWRPTQAALGGSLQLYGGDDAVYVLDTNALELSGDITMAAWVYPTRGVGDPRFGNILSKGDETAGFRLVANTNGVSFSVGGTNALGGAWPPVEPLVSPAELQPNRWHYLALTYAAGPGRLDLYVDGSNVVTRTVEFGAQPNRSLPVNREDLLLGMGFEGMIDEVRVIGGLLGPEEIQKTWLRLKEKTETFRVRVAFKENSKDERYGEWTMHFRDHEGHRERIIETGDIDWEEISDPEDDPPKWRSEKVDIHLSEPGDVPRYRYEFELELKESARGNLDYRVEFTHASDPDVPPLWIPAAGNPGYRESLKEGKTARWRFDAMNGDEDDDYLSDFKEFKIGTDPFDPDTDGDGMDDAWEVDHGLDPRSAADAAADPDGDGHTNIEEYQADPRTDPLVVDPFKATDIGATAGSFSVTPSGQASYTIPITVSPGTAGMAPKLALSYTMKANSVLGVGWAISGLSAVSRTAATMVHDGFVDGVDFDDNDRFALDGQRLIEVAPTVTGALAEYRTEIDTFTRVAAYGTDPNNPDSFKAWTKAGLIYTYGTATSGWAAGGADGKKLTWAVRRIEDQNGNYIDFTYGHLDSGGNTDSEFLVERIDYTGNDAQGLAPYARVTFNYEDAPEGDRTVAHLMGRTMRNTRRLASVVGTFQSQEVRRYTFTYDVSEITGRSLLAYVQESVGEGAGGRHLAPTRFEWTRKPYNDLGYFTVLDWGRGEDIAREPIRRETDPGGLLKRHPSSDENPDAEWVSGDFNNDALTDMALVERRDDGDETRIRVYTSDGGHLNEWPARWYDGGANFATQDRWIPGDFNGDGWVDIAQMHASGGDVNIRLFRNTAQAGFAAEPTFDTGTSWRTNMFFYPADFNADGKLDIVKVSGKNKYSSEDVDSRIYVDVMLNGGTNASGQVIWSRENTDDGDYQSNKGYLQTLLADFTGDGLPDILNFHYDEDLKLFGTLLVNKTRGLTELSLDSKTAFAKQGCVTNYAWTAGDVNGDGMTDLIRLETENGEDIRVYESIGGGNFASPKKWGTAIKFSDESELKTGDFNGDGKADLLVIKNSKFNGYIKGVDRWIYYSTGTSFKVGERIKDVWTRWEDLSFTGDFNGDGKEDMLRVNGDGDFMMCSTGQMIHDVITEIEDGMGRATKIAYATLATPVPQGEPPLYELGDGDGLPAGALNTTAPLPVVRTVTRPTGLAGSGGLPDEYRVHYRYGGLRVHPLRGMLGFRWVEVEDERYRDVGGQTTTTWYEQEFPYTGMPERTVVLGPGGVTNGVSETAYQTVATAVSGGTIFAPYAGDSVETTYELDGSMVVSVTNGISGYDAYGNPGRVEVADSGGFRKITESSYSVDLQNWRVSKLTGSTVTHQAPGWPDVVRTAGFAYDPANGQLSGETSEPGSTEVLPLGTDHGFDAFGNTTRVRSYGPDHRDPGQTVERVTSTGFDAFGRLPVAVTNALGHAETRTYYAHIGAVQSVTGPNDLTTTFAYDAFGRQTGETRPDDTSTATAWFYAGEGPYAADAPALALWYVVTQSSGSAPSVAFKDALDRTIRTVGFTPDNQKVYQDTTFDNFGRVVAATRPHLAGSGSPPTITTEYDVLSRVKKVTTPQAGGTHAEDSFGYAGLTTAETNALGQVRVTIKDTQKRVVQVQDHARAFGGDSAFTLTTTYAHDAAGNLREVTTSDGTKTRTRSMGYDVLGRKTSMSDPDMGTWGYGYNVFGELVSQTDARNVTTETDYDALGRIVGRADPDHASAWVFDTADGKGVGKLHYAERRRVSDNSLVYREEAEYDSLGRPVAQTESITNLTFAVTQTYDDLSRVQTIGYPRDGFTVSNSYDVATGALREVWRGDTAESLWRGEAYNADGNLTQESLGNGLVTDRAYVPETGRVAWIRTQRENPLSQVQSEEFFFDPLGNLTRRTDYWAKITEQQSLDESYTYDDLNRLRAAGAQSFSYDAFGNLTGKNGQVQEYGFGTGGDVRPHALRSVNGGPDYAYDANGNLTAGGGRSLAWNAANLPTAIARGSVAAEWEYDCDNARILFRQTDGSDTTTTLYAAGGLFEHITKPDASVEHRFYVMTPAGRSVVHVQAPGGSGARTRWLHADHLGSVTAISDENGYCVERVSFEAWGGKRALYDPLAENPQSTTRGFTGHEMLDALGLVHMNGRIYDPGTARFLSPDPFVQFPDFSQSYNRYSYVLNNPLSFTDPTGYFLGGLFRAIGSFLGSDGSSIFSTVIGGATAMVLSPFIGPIAAGAVGGFVSGSMNAALNGADFASCMKAGIIQAGIGALTAGVGSAAIAIGQSTGQYLAQYAFSVVSHAAMGGIISEAFGGDVASGMWAGALSAGITGALAIDTTGPSGKFANAAIAAMVGGTAAELGGGKFANGAVTGAFLAMFNDALHPQGAGQGFIRFEGWDSPTAGCDFGIGVGKGGLYAAGGLLLVAAGPVGWAVLGVAVVGGLAYTTYDVYHHGFAVTPEGVGALVGSSAVGAGGAGLAARAAAAKTAVPRNPNVYEALFEAPISGTTRSAHRASANTHLANQLQGNADLAGMMNQQLGGNVLQHMQSGRSLLNPPGTVWHHPANNPNVMQLLRTGEHTAPSLQPVLHPGGVGGFGNFYGP